MRDFIAHNSLGLVATVCADGTPNLSPKGTCLVLDDEHIIFGEIRSPNTRDNLAERAAMEINFVDLFARKAVRVKGVARYLERGTAEFEVLIGYFSKWEELAEKINGVVRLRIDRALLVTSPIYDLGADEAQLREQWRAHFLGE